MIGEIELMNNIMVIIDYNIWNSNFYLTFETLKKNLDTNFYFKCSLLFQMLCVYLNSSHFI